MIPLIICESEYKGGLFPSIPARVSGQDTLLVDINGLPRMVDDYITTRDIRIGSFNKLVRVSTSLFPLDILLKATSKNAPYQFDVTVGLDCRVTDSVAYYMTRETQDIEKNLTIALSRIITHEAKKYSLTDDNVSDGILRKLQEKEQYYLEALGITYTVASVEAKPDADAEQSFTKKMTDHELNILLEKNKLAEVDKLTSRNMESAIMGQVAEGKIDMKTALEQMTQSMRSDGYRKLEDVERIISFIHKLQTENLISDYEASQRINDFIRELPLSTSGIHIPTSEKTPQLEESTIEGDETIDTLLSD